MQSDKIEVSIYELLTAGSEMDMRMKLHEHFQKLGAAGALLFRVGVEDDTPQVLTLWDKDFSEELEHVTPGHILEKVVAHAPRWAIRWLADREKAFWLQRYIHYIPFATQLILKLTSSHNARALADLIMVSHTGKYHYKIIIGWHAPLSKMQVNHLIMLLMAYLRSNDFTHIERNLTGFVLSDTQLACFRWMAAGKSQQEIATIMGMSYANVRYHMEKAKKDSGFATMQQVLVEVTRRYDLSPLGPGR